MLFGTLRKIFIGSSDENETRLERSSLEELVVTFSRGAGDFVCNKLTYFFLRIRTSLGLFARIDFSLTYFVSSGLKCFTSSARIDFKSSS